MATFVAKNSGGVKKKPMIILKEFFFFVLVSTRGASDWQACKDSLKISLTAKRSEFTDVQKLFLLWREIEDKIDHYVSYRVFSCVKQQKMPATDEITS